MKRLKAAAAFCRSIFNWKLAVLSAVFQGIISAWINLDYGATEAAHAAWSQAYGSFFATGFTARMVQYFSMIRRPLPSYFWGSTIPASVTFCLSYGPHWLNGTPEMFWSVAVPTFISFTTCFWTNFATRQGWRWIQP